MKGIKKHVYYLSFFLKYYFIAQRLKGVPEFRKGAWNLYWDYKTEFLLEYKYNQTKSRNTTTGTITVAMKFVIIRT